MNVGLSGIRANLAGVLYNRDPRRLGKLSRENQGRAPNGRGGIFGAKKGGR